MLSGSRPQRKCIGVVLAGCDVEGVGTIGAPAILHCPSGGFVAVSATQPGDVAGVRGRSSLIGNLLGHGPVTANDNDEAGLQPLKFLRGCSRESVRRGEQK